MVDATILGDITRLGVERVSVWKAILFAATLKGRKVELLPMIGYADNSDLATLT